MSTFAATAIEGSSGTLPFEVCATGRAVYHNGHEVVDGPHCVTFSTPCLYLLYTGHGGPIVCSNAAASRMRG